MRIFVLVVSASAFALVLASCRKEEEVPPASPSASDFRASDPSPLESSLVPHGSGQSPHPLGILGNFQYAVVGKLGPLVDRLYSRSAQESSNECPPPDHPKYQACISAPESAAEPSPDIFRYSFEIEQVIKAGDRDLGTEVLVQQHGTSSGAYFDSCGSTSYALTDQEVMRPGSRYLLFLSDDAERGLVGYAFGRFVVGADDLLTPVEDAWLELPGVAAISGLSVDDAIARILNAEVESQADESATTTSFEQCPTA